MARGAQVFLKFISVLGAGEEDEREELRKMQAIFQSFDTNADGEIDIDGGLVARLHCATDAARRAVVAALTVIVCPR